MEPFQAPSVCKGTLTDPVGASKFEGTIAARYDPQRVSELLSDVKANVASARQAPTGEHARAVGP